jgi:hypothetical protein
MRRYNTDDEGPFRVEVSCSLDEPMRVEVTAYAAVFID